MCVCVCVVLCVRVLVCVCVCVCLALRGYVLEPLYKKVGCIVDGASQLGRVPPGVKLELPLLSRPGVLIPNWAEGHGRIEHTTGPSANLLQRAFPASHA